MHFQGRWTRRAGAERKCELDQLSKLAVQPCRGAKSSSLPPGSGPDGFSLVFTPRFSRKARSAASEPGLPCPLSLTTSEIRSPAPSFATKDLARSNSARTSEIKAVVSLPGAPAFLRLAVTGGGPATSGPPEASMTKARGAIKL